MLVTPKYAENIIVGVKTSEKFAWYVSERDIWILDINKYGEAYLKNGFKFDKSFALSLRNNIEIVDEATTISYLGEYSNNIVSSAELKDLLTSRDFDATVLELRPSLYIDFVEKKLLSLYPESLPFEKYVPDGWDSGYADFTQYIPIEDRYWILNQTNIIEKLFEVEKNDFKGE